MYLVMEYCSGGDLAKYIRRHKRIPETAARALLRQLSAGLKDLWARNLVHVRLSLPHRYISGTLIFTILMIVWQCDCIHDSVVRC